MIFVVGYSMKWDGWCVYARNGESSATQEFIEGPYGTKKEAEAAING